VGIFDVDCTAAGESLCGKHGVRGYPTIKVFKKDGNPKGEDYNGPREYSGLKRYVEANLAGPECSLEDKEGCSPEERKTLEESEAMSVGDRRTKIQEMEESIKDKKKQAEALQKEVANLRHKLQQFETGHRGSSLLQALMNFGGGNNDPLGEMSVCGQSVCSTRVQEPRTPNPKGSATGVKTPRTQRTPSQGPLSARRGQTNVEAEPCRNCALQERASQRTIVDFQHFVALMERAVFIGDAGGDSTDPSSMLEQLRKIVAGGSGRAQTQP